MPARRDDKRPVALYRHFDKKTNLLYAGISSNFFARIGQHQINQATWLYEIDHVTVQWFSTRSQAMKAEKKAIKKENPKYNIVHTPRHREGRIVKNLTKRHNYHFSLPERLGKIFNKWAEEESRSQVSMFRQLIKRETEARGE